MEVASPTVEAGIPRPPVKWNGREEELVERGVERKRDQRFVKAPRWKSKNAVVRRVRRTLRVKIRVKGRVWVERGFSLKSGSEGGDSVSFEGSMAYWVGEEEVKSAKAWFRRWMPISNFPLRVLSVWGEVSVGVQRDMGGEDKPLQGRRRQMRL
jgi:hypothetical protein